jgi:hypothetical protein
MHLFNEETRKLACTRSSASGIAPKLLIASTINAAPVHDNNRFVQVNGYVDHYVPMLARMYERRLKGYSTIIRGRGGGPATTP